MITSKSFTYHAKTNELIAEASDLRWGAAPKEFQVRSERTGQVRTFYRTFTSIDREREVQYWRYACREDTRMNAVVFND